MKYRKYISQINIGATIMIALSLAACATTSEREPSSVDSDEQESNQKYAPKGHFDGREPAAMKGNVNWLNEVEDEFGRVAAETSHRAVASQNQHEVLLKHKDWSFSYLPKTNHFYVVLQGTQYQM